MGILKSLFGGCEHKYNIIATYAIMRKTHFQGDIEIGTEYHSQCEKCGNMKQTKMMAK